MPFRLFYKRNEKVKLLIRLGPYTKKRNKRERSVILGAFCLFRLVGSWFHEGYLFSDGAFSCGIVRKAGCIWMELCSTAGLGAVVHMLPLCAFWV